MTAVGIDLGTSNSVVAVYRRGRPEALPIEGRHLVPSCVAVKPGGGLLVGNQAKTRSLVDPVQAVVAIKRHMGDRDYHVALGGQSYSPVDISSLILKKLVEGAGEQLGEAVKEAVISVPAYFTNNQKEDTRRAGEMAGLRVLSLVPEPTAAAIAYGVNQGRDQTIMVYDLGGGTFDLSILQIQGNNFQVRAIGGCDTLGGEDFDRRFLQLLLNRLREPRPGAKPLSDQDAQQLLVKLKEAAEAAKKELSQSEDTEVEIQEPALNIALRVRITRAEYEAEIQDLVQRTITITLDTLRQAKLSPEDVDRIVLVGGSTRIPLIHKALTQRIREPYIADNVDEVVAHGAAILAANLTSVAEANLAPLEVTNITAHSLGIRADQDRFAVLIPRGSKLPVTMQKTFTTARDNADRTDVIIFQGEESQCSNNEQIGGFGLTGITRAKAGVPKIDVTFRVDTDDILQVTAQDRSTASGGTVRIERFVPQPYEPAPEQKGRDLSSLRFATSKVGCDDAGSVLTRLGLRYKTLDHVDFRKLKKLRPYDLIFINCMADMSQLAGAGLFLNPGKNANALREFVQEGGSLYVSDLARENISVPFPGKIDFGGKMDGQKGDVAASVLDPELKQLVGPTCPLSFPFAYSLVRSVTSDCRVYLARGREPLLVSFPYGKGHVIYTSFHSGGQQSDKAMQLLSFIILQTIALATSTPLVELAEKQFFRKP